MQQLGSLLPKFHVRLHISLDQWLGGAATTTLGAHGLLGIENGVVFQFGPRGEGGIQVLLAPLGIQHEIGCTLAFILIVQHFQRLHPLGDDGLVPVNLAHALLHLLEGGQQGLPVGLFVFQYLLGGGDTHGCHHVCTLGNGAFRRLAVVVHHFL